MFCPNCGEVTRDRSDVCQVCTQPIVPEGAEACPSCNMQIVDESDRFCRECGYVVHPSVPAVAVASSRSLAPAPFGLRCLAFVIDACVMMPFGLPLEFASRLLDNPAIGFVGQLVIGVLYFTYCESSEWQGTLGKKGLNLMVVDKNGRRLTMGAAATRYIGKFASAMICCIGYLMPLWMNRGQALHDMVAGAYVVKKTSAPSSHT